MSKLKSRNFEPQSSARERSGTGSHDRLGPCFFSFIGDAQPDAFAVFVPDRDGSRAAIPLLTDAYPEWPSSWRRLGNLTKSASSPVREISCPTIDSSFPIGPIYVKNVTQVAFDLVTQLSLAIWNRVQPMVGAECR